MPADRLVLGRLAFFAAGRRRGLLAFWAAGADAASLVPAIAASAVISLRSDFPGNAPGLQVWRKDDAAFKKLADETIAALAKSGELAKLYDKWFVQPIPPKGARLNMTATDTNKQAWANLNDKPAEDYAKK